jgi:uncharacterized OB-fold protein
VTTRLVPTASPDTRFFWDGLRERKLLIQRCRACGRLRHPPRPMCPACTSLSWGTVEASGQGTVHSFVMPQHPPDPFIEAPYIVALVDLDEGTRLVSNLVGITPRDAAIGMRVSVTYLELDDGTVLHQFAPLGRP